MTTRAIDLVSIETDTVFELFYAGIDYAQQDVEFAERIGTATREAVQAGYSKAAIFFAGKEALNRYGEEES